MPLSDGTRVDRVGVLRTRFYSYVLVPLVRSVRPITVITLGLLFELQLCFIVLIFHAFFLLTEMYSSAPGRRTYFYVLPFADMWDTEHLGPCARTRGISKR